MKEKKQVPPPSLNPNLAKWKLKNAPPQYPTVSELFEGILAGNRVRLSQAITLVESTRPDHAALAQQLIEKCLPHAAKSVRIGITGTPGVGKSTFIEAFGLHHIENTGGRGKVAVLAIDPSSQVTHGSILGDKTRMMQLAAHANAFVRPSAAGETLGGVARKTRETILLCEAAGYDLIVVETVGVGQSEIAVQSMTDFFLLLLLPGAGDELQGIKRGIVEMADLIAVNKADGERESLAKQARAFYRNAIHYLPPKESGWLPPVLLCSALSKMGIADIHQLLFNFKEKTLETGFFEQNRQQQSRFWLHETINELLRQYFFQQEDVKKMLNEIEQKVVGGTSSPFSAAEKLMETFLTSKK
ncbi:MAG: hypothetical protein RL757_1972 [Bacteroidota bacterium]|jgi:LAO/AO transport system kinase